MINPDLLRIDTYLANFLQMFRNADEEYLAEEILPLVPTDKQSGEIATISESSLLKLGDDLVSREARPNEREFRVTKKMYRVSEHALSSHASYSEIRDAANPIRPLEIRMAAVAQGIMLNREDAVRKLVATPDAYAVSNRIDLAGAARWDTATGDPYKNMLEACRRTFGMPTVAVMGLDVFNALRQSPKMAESLYGDGKHGSAMSFEADLAKLIGVGRVIVSKVRYDASPKADQSDMKYLWRDKSFAVLNASMMPVMQNSVFGAIFESQKMYHRMYQDHARGGKGSVTVVVGCDYDVQPISNISGAIVTNVIS